jgi:hypothetical protein
MAYYLKQNGLLQMAGLFKTPLLNFLIDISFHIKLLNFIIFGGRKKNSKVFYRKC